MNDDKEKYKESKYQWLRLGLFFGIWMYVFSTILFPLIDGRGITQKELLIGIPMWAIAGFLFAFTMKIINRRKKLKTHHK